MSPRVAVSFCGPLCRSRCRSLCTSFCGSFCGSLQPRGASAGSSVPAGVCGVSGFADIYPWNGGVWC